jgi:hypothetical protein
LEDPHSLLNHQFRDVQLGTSLGRRSTVELVDGESENTRNQKVCNGKTSHARDCIVATAS